MVLSPAVSSAARPPVAAWADRIQLLGQHYLVELFKPAEQSTGGVWLPERYQENWTHGKVRASGPGECFEIDGRHLRSTLWLQPGDEALFCKHNFHSAGAPHLLGTVRDEALVAAVIDNGLVPMNDWVMIQQDPDEPDPSAEIAYAEEYRPKPLHGLVFAYGPGKVERKGPLTGVRRPVSWITSRLDYLGSDPLIGKRVWWSRECEVISMGREHLEAIFVQAEDLLFIQED